MPHFVIEGNTAIAKLIDLNELNTTVFQTAVASNLFKMTNIKSRVKLYEHSIVANYEKDFIHIWVYIHKGRSFHQKRELSESLVKAIQQKVPEVFSISCNVMELDGASYFKIQKEDS